MSALRNAWGRLGSLQQRTITAVILAPLFLLILFYGGWAFTALVMLMALLAYREWLALVNGPLWNAAGLVYIGASCSAMIWLRQAGDWFSPNHDWLPLLMAMMAVWATDIGAYFTGRRFGGPKVAPSISPNKTWSGLIGGSLAAGLILALLAAGFAVGAWWVYMIAGMVLAIIAQIGDFFESWLKRRAGVKDSGTLIPGHGGLLDRIDGVLTAVPCFALFIWILS